VVVTLALSSTIAAAQTEDEKRAAARGLAQSGLNAFNEGKLDDAIDRFRRAEALVHAPPHLLYIARASASLGKLVQANEAYLRIVREEVASTAPKAFVDAKKSATQEQAALEPRIPKLTIVVKVGQGASGAAGNAPEPVVTMDGAVVPAALVGVAHPVDPGAHTLSATARGYKANDVAIKVNESASETATLTLVPDGSAVVAAESKPPQESKEPSAKKSGFGVAPWVAFGVGVVGLGAGTFFVAQNRSKRDEADNLCGGGVCPAAQRGEIESLDAKADSAATYAWISYAIGAAGIAAGAALIIVSKSSSSSAKSAPPMLQAWAFPGAAGLKGAF